MVSNHMANINCSKTVYKYTWNPKQQNRIRLEKFIGKIQLTFLPDWYIKEFSLDKH